MPNIDLVKIAKIVVLLGIIVVLLGFLANLDIGSADGQRAWWQLGQPPQTGAGQTMDWSPLSIATVLLPSAGVNIPAIVGTIALSALVAVFVAFLIKVIIRVVGS